eukprot:jgi/Chrzof1/2120/Cz11g03100.t1
MRRCLAASPRLPAADWAGLCKYLLTASATAAVVATAGGSEELQEAAMQLVLSHMHVPQHGLSTVVDYCITSSAVFSHLGHGVQCLLMQRLADILHQLPVNRVRPLLLLLPQLVSVACEKSEAAQKQDGCSHDVAAAVWDGLEGCSTQLAEKDLLMSNKVRHHVAHSTVLCFEACDGGT